MDVPRKCWAIFGTRQVHQNPAVIQVPPRFGPWPALTTSIWGQSPPPETSGPAAHSFEFAEKLRREDPAKSLGLLLSNFELPVSNLVNPIDGYAGIPVVDNGGCH